MHGANVDQLGRRDPALYGTLTLAELERQIEDDATRLELEVSFFHTDGARLALWDLAALAAETEQTPGDTPAAGFRHTMLALNLASPEEVDAVITTHLHWDHAGGMTRRDAEGGLALTFPKARHFIQKSEWDFALHPDIRSQTGYVADDFTPLADGKSLIEFLNGDAEVLPGVEIRHVGGHTPGSQVVILRAGELACAVTGDLVCQTPHLRVPWNMSADLEPLRVFEQKARLFEEAERHRWLLVLSHEPDQPAGYLEDGGRWRPEPRLA